MDKDKIRNYQMREAIGDEDDSEEDEEVYFYDVDTKKHYMYDGTSLVEVPAMGEHPATEDELSDILKKEFEERERIGEEDPEGVGVDLDDIFDPETIEQASLENAVAKKKERKKLKELEQRRKARQERRERGGAPILKQVEDLKFDIEELISEQVKAVFGNSWKKLNKTYNSNTGNIIAPGRVKVPQNKIPLLQVYFDQSVSWTDYDIRVGMDVLSVLDEYMEKKQLIVDVKYFSEHVYDDAASARAEGNTWAGPLVVEDIIETDPDNVLIMTDADFDYQCSDSFKKIANVRGGAWFLFKRGKFCNWITKRVHGDMETKYYKY